MPKRLHILSIGLAVTGAVALAGCSSTPPCERDVEAYVIAQNFVRAELRAPASAEFATMDRAENTSTPTKLADGRCAFDIRMAVDAQNGFGAKLRQRFSLTVIPDPSGSHNWTLAKIIAD